MHVTFAERIFFSYACWALPCPWQLWKKKKWRKIQLNVYHGRCASDVRRPASVVVAGSSVSFWGHVTSLGAIISQGKGSGMNRWEQQRALGKTKGVELGNSCRDQHGTYMARITWSEVREVMWQEFCIPKEGTACVLGDEWKPRKEGQHHRRMQRQPERHQRGKEQRGNASHKCHKPMNRFAA